MVGKIKLTINISVREKKSSNISWLGSSQIEAKHLLYHVRKETIL